MMNRGFFSGKRWIILIALIAIIAGFMVVNSVYQPFKRPPPAPKTIEVPEITCRIGANHIIWIRNIGPADMSTEEVSIEIDGSVSDCWSWNGDLRAGDLAACISTFNTNEGRHEITVSGPANAVSSSDTC